MGIFRLLFPLLFLLIVFSAAAQEKPCQPDLSGANASLKAAQAALEKSDLKAALKAVSQTRAALQLIESNCLPHAKGTAGISRTNPTPLGQTHKVNLSTHETGSLQVTKVTTEADDAVKATNQQTPGTGMRFVLVEFDYACEVKPEQTCNVKPSAFALVGSKGVIYEYQAALNKGYSKAQELFGGGQASLRLVFEVPTEETGLIFFNREPTKQRIFFATQ